MKKIFTFAVAGALMAVTGMAQAERDGKAIYDTKCFACHASGVAGAPKLGDKTAWAPRIKQGDAVLLQNATKGLRAMPPKGTCMDCTDGEMKAAISYIVSQAK